MIAAQQVQSVLLALAALVIVIIMLLIPIPILRALKRLGGRLWADVEAWFKQKGQWGLRVRAAGLLGSYLAIVITEFYGLYFLMHFIIIKPFN
jgi:hypothetical protein